MRAATATAMRVTPPADGEAGAEAVLGGDDGAAEVHGHHLRRVLRVIPPLPRPPFERLADRVAQCVTEVLSEL
jgi:hypothetical protein